MPPDVRDDVYALGVIWHQLLAGNPAAELPTGRGWRKRLTNQGCDARVRDRRESCVEYEPADRPADSGTNVQQTERFDPASGKWSDEGVAAKRELPLYPRMHLLPNGNVFYNAAGQAFNPSGQSYGEALWNIAATYDPKAKK